MKNWKKTCPGIFASRLFFQCLTKGLVVVDVDDVMVVEVVGGFVVVGGSVVVGIGSIVVVEEVLMGWLYKKWLMKSDNDIKFNGEYFCSALQTTGSLVNQQNLYHFTKWEKWWKILNDSWIIYVVLNLLIH